MTAQKYTTVTTGARSAFSVQDLHDLLKLVAESDIGPEGFVTVKTSGTEDRPYYELLVTGNVVNL